MKNKPENITGYIAGFPEDVQKLLEQVHNTIKKAAPQNCETAIFLVYR